MEMEEFGDFGALDMKMSQDINLEHAFKAEKVTFRDVSRLFAEIAIFAPKGHLSVKIRFWGGIPHFLGQKCTFPALGPQNTFRMLMFI